MKNPMLSKTLWTNFLLAAFALFFTPAQEWMAENPTAVAVVWSGINMALRFFTKDKLSIAE